MIMNIDLFVHRFMLCSPPATTASERRVFRIAHFLEST